MELGKDGISTLRNVDWKRLHAVSFETRCMIFSGSSRLIRYLYVSFSIDIASTEVHHKLIVRNHE